MKWVLLLLALFGASPSASFTLVKPVRFSRCLRAAATDCPLPGTAKLDVDWKDLGFEFRPTKSHLKLEYKDGAWGKPELVSEPYIKLHIGATALHYGQACFE